MYKGNTVSFILAAAGAGERFGRPYNKVFEEMNGQPVLLWSFAEAVRHPAVDEIVVVCRDGEEAQVAAMTGAKLPGVTGIGAEGTDAGEYCPAGMERKPVRIVTGGERRVDSVLCALKACSSDIVLIHDAARPHLKASYIDLCLAAMDNAPAATIAVPAKDTIKLACAPCDGQVSGTPDSQVADPGTEAAETGSLPGTYVRETVPRALAWHVQTPQCFRRDLLLDAHERFGQDPDITDDCMLMERAGHPVLLLMGDYTNIKITTPEDLAVSELHAGKESCF